MKVVSVINYKGGVGKTTLVSNLAAYVASQNRRVLMIDLDPQMSLTFSFIPAEKWKNDYAKDRTLKNFFDSIIYKLTPISLSNLIIPIFDSIFLNGGRLDLISSHLSLIDIDITLASTISSSTPALLAQNFLMCYNHIRYGLKVLKDDYDLVMIDCPPNFYAVVKNAITASDYCIVPAKMDYLSTLGVEQLKENMDKYINSEYQYYMELYNRNRPDGAVEYLPVNTEIMGIVPTMVTIQNQMPVQANANFINELKNKNFYIFPWMRNNATIFGAIPANGIPVILSYPKITSFLTWRTTIKPELIKLGDEFIKRAKI